MTSSFTYDSIWCSLGLSYPFSIYKEIQIWNKWRKCSIIEWFFFIEKLTSMKSVSFFPVTLTTFLVSRQIWWCKLSCWIIAWSTTKVIICKIRTYDESYYLLVAFAFVSRCSLFMDVICISASQHKLTYIFIYSWSKNVFHCMLSGCAK